MTMNGMYEVSDYKRKPVINIRQQVYLNGKLWRVVSFNSGTPLNDTEVVEKALLATLGQFFSVTASNETAYRFARDFFNRLLEEKELPIKEKQNPI